VLQDDFAGAFHATEHLIKSGYTRIAHIAGNRHLAFTRDRLSGYLEALKKHEIPAREEWILFSGFSQQCGEEDMNHLLQLSCIPDSVFAVNDRKAVGAIKSVKKHGLDVGKDIGIIGFTNDPISTIIEPELTTIEEPAFDIGKKSCELLIKHIKNKLFLPKLVVLPSSLIERSSCLKEPRLL
jgi:LacI family transcriptional regulator